MSWQRASVRVFRGQHVGVNVEKFRQFIEIGAGMRIGIYLAVFPCNTERTMVSGRERAKDFGHLEPGEEFSRGLQQGAIGYRECRPWVLLFSIGPAGQGTHEE